VSRSARGHPCTRGRWRLQVGSRAMSRDLARGVGQRFPDKKQNRRGDGTVLGSPHALKHRSDEGVQDLVPDRDPVEEYEDLRHELSRVTADI